MKSTKITTFVLIGILTGPTLGFEKLARAVNNLFSGNSEQKLAASGSLKCYESVNDGLGEEVICKDSTSASILGDGDGPFKCARVTTTVSDISTIVRHCVNEVAFKEDGCVSTGPASDNRALAKVETCYCSTDLCNSSVFHGVNFALFGILVIIYHLK